MRRVLVLFLVTSLAVPTAAQAQQIAVRTDPTGAAVDPQEEIRVPVARGSTDATLTVFLSATKATENVKLSAPLDDDRQATFTPDGGNAGAAFTVPKEPGRVQVTITVTDPDDRAIGPLYAVVDNRFTRIGTLRVDRPATTGLSIEDAANNTKSLSTATGTLDQRIAIVNDTAQEIRGVRLRVTQLKDPRGDATVSLTASVGGRDAAEGPFDVPANDRVEVRLTARDLDLAGDWTAQLTLRYGDKSNAVQLVVTRTRAQTAVVITNPPADQVDTGPDGSGTAAFRILIEESEGRTVTLSPPTVTVLRREGEGTRTADYESVTVQPASTSAGAPAAQNADLAPITVPGGGSALAEVRVEGLDGPGEFTIEVRWPGGPSSKVATASASLRVGWKWALLLVLLPAILVGTFIRLLRGKVAPRLAEQAALAGAAERFEDVVAANPPGSAELRVIEELRRRIDAALKREEGAAEPRAMRDELVPKLPILARWLRAADDLDALDDPLESARAHLEKVGVWLRDPGSDSAEALQWLADAEAAIATAPRVDALLDELDEAFQAWKAEYRVGKIPDVAGTADQKLDEGRAHYAEDKFPEAAGAIEAAARAFLSGVAEELEAPKAGEIPTGVSEDAWDNLESSLTALVVRVRGAGAHPRDATAAYRQGMREYLAVRVAGLHKALDEHRPAPTAPRRKAIADRLDGAQASLAADNLRAAADQERKAAEALEKLPKEADAGAAAVAANGDGESRLAPAGTSADLGTKTKAGVGGLLRGRRRAGGGVRATWRSRRTKLTTAMTVLNVITFVLVGVITAGLGVSLLWSGNPTWGDAEDWLAAALWGLGLQAAGTGVFADLTETSGRLGGAGRQ